MTVLTTEPSLTIPDIPRWNVRPFPIGARLDNGKYAITEQLNSSSTWDKGTWRGIRTTDGAKVIVSMGNRQKDPNLAKLRADLALNIEGIAPLLYIGPLEYEQDKFVKTSYDCMVELEPKGVPLSALLPDKIPSEFKLKLVFDCAVRVLEAEEKGQTMGGMLRPEYIYVNPDAQVMNDCFSGLVPRSELFLNGAKLPSYGIPPLFDHIYFPAELYMDKKVRDAYNLIAILVCVLIGEPPFAGDYLPDQLDAYASGELRHEYDVLSVPENVIRLMKDGMQWYADDGVTPPPPTVQSILRVLLLALGAQARDMLSTKPKLYDI